MNEADFWKTTPREFAAMLRRSAEKALELEKRAWKHTSAVLAMLASIATQGTQQWSAEEFDPYAEDEKPKTSIKDLLAFIAQTNKDLGGEDVRPAEKITRMN